MTQQELRNEVNIACDSMVNTLAFFMTEYRNDFSPKDIAKMFNEEFAKITLQIAEEISEEKTD